jgi:tetratricopeptide (TPR) repeat protein
LDGENRLLPIVGTHTIGAMSRRISVLLAAVVLAAGSGGHAQAAPSDAADLLQIPRLLDDLSHTDTAVRDGASEKLAAIGAPARPELIRAARSDDPEQRTRAAGLLRKLPWYTATDPQPVRTLLERYGPADDRMRLGLLWQISELSGGVDALLRLLHEEPSHPIRWFIVALLTNERDIETQKKILALESAATAADDAPLLVLLGNVLIERDRDKALDCFRRATEAEEKRPGVDIGVLGLAFDALTDDCLSRGDVESAADLLRRQVRRDGLPHMAARTIYGQSEPHALARLMALHTYFGPLRHYHADVAQWGDGRAIGAPLRWRIALLMTRLGSAPPLPWQPFEFAGDQHLAAGAFLLRNKLHFAAESELHKALVAPAKGNPHQLEVHALLALGRSVADRKGDDETAADFLERAMHTMRTRDLGFAHPSRRTDDDTWAEIHWRRARAAHARGDHAGADARIKSLLQLLPTNTDMTIEMIDWLKQSGHTDDARVLFDKVYIQTDAKLDAATDEEKPGMKNDLAWLCARVGERLDEAQKLAREAVEAQPDNAAFIDTLAEACFRDGKIDEAIAHERRALEIEPDNVFMREQIARFRAARGGKRATSTATETRPAAQEP